MLSHGPKQRPGAASKSNRTVWERPLVGLLLKAQLYMSRTRKCDNRRKSVLSKLCPVAFLLNFGLMCVLQALAAAKKPAARENGPSPEVLAEIQRKMEEADLLAKQKTAEAAQEAAKKEAEAAQLAKKKSMVTLQVCLKHLHTTAS